jgi:hypothetical protein
VLVVYAAYTTRATLQDGLYAFRRYSDARVFYLNLRVRQVPRSLLSIDFDLVIFHTLFFAGRYEASFIRNTFARARPLRALRAYKVALPQDEYINSDVVNDFINEFGIDAVFSVQPPHEWRTIYNTVDQDRVKFYPVLTGYLDDRRIRRLRSAWRDLVDRPIDIGYRTTGRAHAWFGRHGFLKERIAEVFLDRAPARGLRLDISTSERDTLLGNQWYDFLGRCKYVLGVEGGTSILDRDGTIRQRTEGFRVRHPHASFEEIEQACFPGLDGTFSGFALSPRHLEACATGTCQILTEGRYNDVLQPGVHYVPLKRDFSNIEEVLDLVARDERRRSMVERAYHDVVASGRYSQRAFVAYVFERRGEGAAAASARRRPLVEYCVYRWMWLLDACDRLLSILTGAVIQPLRHRSKTTLARLRARRAT